MPEQLMSTISQLKGRKISHNISPCRSCLLVALLQQLLLQLLHSLNKKTALPTQQYNPRTLPRHRQQRGSLLLRTPASCPSVYSEQIAVQMADGKPRHSHLAGRAEKTQPSEQNVRRPMIEGPWIRTGIGALSLSSSSLLSHLGLLIPPL